ncbi:MAG: hypothetical protein R2822_29735 [Spirosomataceae bacterium]
MSRKDTTIERLKRRTSFAKSYFGLAIFRPQAVLPNTSVKVF